MLWQESIPIYEHIDINKKTTKIEIVAGEIEKHKAPSPPPDSWASNEINEVAIWNIQMEAGATWKLPQASEGVTRTVYFFKGDKLTIEDVSLSPYHSAEVDANTAITLEAGNEKCSILILQGRPIGEPVVQHGPMVMNTKEEINQAFSDYQRTGFGGWPWPVSGPVHAKGKGRFAAHADGTVETRG